MSVLVAAWAGLAAVLVQPEVSSRPAGVALRLDSGDVPPRAGARLAARPLRNLALSDDGDEILIGGDATVAVWDADSGRLKRGLRLTDEADRRRQPDVPGIAALGLAADGSVFALAGERLIRWDLDGIRRVVSLDGLGASTQGDASGGPRLAAFSPAGRVLVEFGEQPPIGLWDASTGRRRHALDRSVWADLFAFSPDGRRLAVARMVRLHLFDVETGEQLWRKRLEGTVRHIRFDADGTRLTALVDYEGRVEIDAATGNPPPADPFQPPLRPPLRYSRGGGSERKIVAVSPDGTLVAECESLPGAELGAASKLGAGLPTPPRLRVWELATGRDVLVLNGHSQPVSAAVFLSDSRRLVSATADGRGLVWDLTSPDFAAVPPTMQPLTPDEGAALWRQLGDDSGEAAWGALVALVHRPEDALRLAASPPGLEGLARRLVAQLDHADSSLRALAMRRLASMSVAVEALLREALEANPSVEAAARLRRLLRRLAGPDKQDEVARLARARRHRDLRTIRLLEWIGTPEARRLLEERRLEWQDPQVATEAAGALHRWPEPLAR